MNNNVLFLGSKRIGLASLKALIHCASSPLIAVVTPDDSSDTRSCTAEFIALCSRHAIALYVVKSQREADAVLSELQPGRCLVVGWYWLFGPQVLKKVPGGIIGIHNSLLPSYRGCAPLVWAMINGEERVGISLFSFSEGMDDGPVWGQRAVLVSQSDTIGTVLARLEVLAADLITAVWPEIETGTISPALQCDSEATYCGLRTPEDGWIDWTRSSMDVNNFVRAQSAPYPGAWTTIGLRRKIIVWSSEPSTQKYFGTPGQVLQLLTDGVLVSCGHSSALLLKTVALEGCEPVHPRSFINSLKIRFGSLGVDHHAG